jgi:hypothetical protein
MPGKYFLKSAHTGSASRSLHDSESRPAGEVGFTQDMPAVLAMFQSCCKRPGCRAALAGGKELYYLSPDFTLMAAAISMQRASFMHGTPKALFQTRAANTFNRQSYDVARDGRFLIPTDVESASTESIHLLPDWKPPK